MQVVTELCMYYVEEDATTILEHAGFTTPECWSTYGEGHDTCTGSDSQVFKAWKHSWNFECTSTLTYFQTRCTPWGIIIHLYTTCMEPVLQTSWQSSFTQIHKHRKLNHARVYFGFFSLKCPNSPLWKYYSATTSAIRNLWLHECFCCTSKNEQLDVTGIYS